MEPFAVAEGDSRLGEGYLVICMEGGVGGGGVKEIWRDTNHWPTDRVPLSVTPPPPESSRSSHRRSPIRRDAAREVRPLVS